MAVNSSLVGIKTINRTPSPFHGGDGAWSFLSVRSLVVILLSLPLLSLSGCYESVTLSKNQVSELDRHQKITVYVDSGRTALLYRFSAGLYGVVNDTIVGIGSTVNSRGEEIHGSLSVPVSRISSIETERIDVLRTALLGASAVVATTAVIFSLGSGIAGQGFSSAPQQPR